MSTSNTSKSRQKLFTSEEANRMLPLVSVIVRDIRSSFEGYSTCKKEIGQRKQESMLANDAAQKDILDALQKQMDAHSRELKDLVRELTQLGALIKDPIEGVVDFPFLHEGAVAYMCWKHGDDKVTDWHGENEGYAARQPLPDPSTADLRL